MLLGRFGTIQSNKVTTHLQKSEKVREMSKETVLGKIGGRPTIYFSARFACILFVPLLFNWWRHP